MNDYCYCCQPAAAELLPRHRDGVYRVYTVSDKNKPSLFSTQFRHLLRCFSCNFEAFCCGIISVCHRAACSRRHAEIIPDHQAMKQHEHQAPGALIAGYPYKTYKIYKKTVAKRVQNVYKKAELTPGLQRDRAATLRLVLN